MPLYLKSIGFSVLLIGILEGIAEATAGFSKGYFGKISDISRKRVPYVRWGYSLSAISKPMLGIMAYPVWIFFARTLDRLGKGIRTASRDAILSDETTPENKGKVFGFHRGMDTLGAALGPTVALIFLFIYPEQYRWLFFIAFIPGVIAIITTSLLKEKSQDKTHQMTGIKSDEMSNRTNFFSFISYWKTSTTNYKRLVIALLVLTLVNSSDVFLLLAIRQNGWSDQAVIGVYIFYNIVYAIFSYPLGSLGDKIGLRQTFTIGMVLFVIVYGGMAFGNSGIIFVVLFMIYGLYMAASEGISKAWISNICDKKDIATAIGFYTSFGSICTLLASTLAGLIWITYGLTATFLVTAFVALLVLVYLLVVRIDNRTVEIV
jgi:MFS family permease